MAMKVLFALLLGVQVAVANVEKTIFLGPEAVNIPSQHPTLDDLHLDVLTPNKWSLRTHIQAEFPTDSYRHGKATWFLLDHLTDGQRYEVRVCWPATQPTSFTLETYELQTVWDTPELINSLGEYSRSRQEGAEAAPDEQQPRLHQHQQAVDQAERSASVLFLRVLAAVDYFTTNASLMRDVPPVFADVILDPYLLGVLPRSLAPTAGYVAIVAVVSWLVASRIVVPWLRGVVAAETSSSSRAKKEQ